MCARYYIQESIYEDIEPLVGAVEEEERITGDVHPSECPPIIVFDQKPVLTTKIAWGYPARKGKGLLINARAETVMEKPTFRNGIRHRRCLLPASGFYEWDAEKNKVECRAKKDGSLFLAGCYDVFDNERYFTIITTTANESMQLIHDRMPLMIGMEDAGEWLSGEGYPELLKRQMPPLHIEREFVQLTIADLLFSE